MELNTDTDLGVGVFLPRDIEGHDVEMMAHADGDAGEARLPRLLEESSAESVSILLNVDRC